MLNLSIPDGIQEIIRGHLLSVADNKTRQNEIKEFLGTLKPRLQERVCLYIFFVAINKNDLMSKMIKDPEFIDHLKGINFKRREFSLHYKTLYE